jgi:hypothetical protein
VYEDVVNSFKPWLPLPQNHNYIVFLITTLEGKGPVPRGERGAMDMDLDMDPDNSRVIP